MRARILPVSLILACTCAVVAQEEPVRLNSLVVRFADLNLADEPVTAREVAINLDEDAWLYIALQGSAVGDERAQVLLRADDDERVVLDGPGEIMHRVPAGDVTVRLVAANAPRLERLVVRRVPEIMVYMFEGLQTPSPQQWITHSWDFLEGSVLRSANLVVSPLADDYAPYAEAWQERGGRWLINQGMTTLREETVDPGQYWRDLLGGSPWDGSIHDEIVASDPPRFPRLAQGLREFAAAPESAGKTVYLFCGGASAIGDPSVLDYFGAEETTAAEGARSIRCGRQGDAVITARQLEVALEPGVEYTLSAWLRTEDSVPATYSGLFVIDEGWHARYATMPAPAGDSDWTRVERSFTPRPSGNGFYQVLLVGPSEGTLWVDTVQLEPGAQATEFRAGPPNLLGNPSFEDGLSGWLRGADEDNPLRDAVIELGQAFAPEIYLHEQPTEEAARAAIDQRLTRLVAAWGRHYPGVLPQTLIVLSAGNCALRYSNDQRPEVSYKALLDLQMHAMATEPAFEELRGVGFWSGHYIDEEIVRWYGALFRHYCIEGSRERLYADPYMLDHLTNPGFEEGLTDWETQGSVEALAVAEMPQGGARGRYAPVPQGAAVIRTVRADGPPNSFAQAVRNLQPGRLYSLKLYCTDPQYSDRLIPAEITIEGGEVVPERTLDHVWRVGDIRWTMHQRVFRATAPDGRLTVADAAPGEVYWDFMQIEPYFGEF